MLLVLMVSTLVGVGGESVGAATGVRLVSVASHQNGQVQFRVTVSPAASNISSHVGLAHNASSDLRDLAAAVQFLPDGRLVALNGSSYRSDREIRYQAGKNYEFEFSVNERGRTARVSVTVDGRRQTLLGTGHFPGNVSEREPITTVMVRDSNAGRGLTLRGVETLLRRTATARGVETVPRDIDLQPDTLEVIVTPSRHGMTGFVGFADHAARSVSSLLGGVELRPDGTMVARRGSGTTAERTVRFQANRSYVARFKIDANRDTYNVEIRQSGSGSFVPLATNAPLRRKVSSLSSVDTLVVSSGRAGDHLTATSSQWVPSDIRIDARSGPRVVEHVVLAGQSLAVGWQPRMSDVPTGNNLMFSTGLQPKGNLVALAPLAEGTGLSTLESMSTSMANWLSAQGTNRTGVRMLMSSGARGGAGYTSLRSGSEPYRAALDQVRVASNLARARGWSYRVPAVALVHGETDSSQGHSNYERYLRTWQRDYERDIQRLTGNRSIVPMLQTQVSSWTANYDRTSKVAQAQYVTGIGSPERLPLVGPKYFLSYDHGGSLGTSLHITADAQRQLGGYYAKVYDQIVRRNQTWRPLHPTNARVSGSRVTLDFHVPKPPLVLDTNLVSNPGNYGFEFSDGTSSPPRITRVAVSGSRVTLDLSAPPRGSNLQVRYAWTGTPGQKPGPRTGVRGNLRDSDPARSEFGHQLYNWAVHFSVPVSGGTNSSAPTPAPTRPTSSATTPTTVRSAPSSSSSSASRDTQRPTSVRNLSARSISTGIQLRWAASSDNKRVTNYVVSRSTNGTAGVQIARLGPATVFNDNNTRPGVRYSYSVRAVDAAGNMSWHSSVISATRG